MASSPADDRSAIVAAYVEMDRAFGLGDAKQFSKAFAPELRVRDERGAEKSLDARQIEQASEYLLRPIPSKQVVRHERTDIYVLEMHGDTADAGGTRTQEVLVVDAAGTRGHVRDVDRFREKWTRTGTGWRLSESSTASYRRFEEGAPSPALMAQLQQMRTLNAQMRGFNAANNLSKCMSSNALESLSFDERRSHCSP